jgi:uncharacterized protein YndB with AHSA1/START domain
MDIPCAMLIENEIIIAVASESPEREIKIRRVIDAPREVVWEAWTQQHLIMKWLPPKDAKVAFQAVDVRQGGCMRYIVNYPDGRNFQHTIIFKDLEKPDHLSYTHKTEGTKSSQFYTTVTFEILSGKTETVMTMLFNSTQERDEAVSELNIYEEGKKGLDNLNQFLSEQIRSLYK